MTTITLKELHGTTGKITRRAGSAGTPLYITDRGRVIAALCNPALIRPKTRTRALLPEFKNHMKKSPKGLLKNALNATRGKF